MIPVNTIDHIVRDFYKIAIKDIMIGYHFRHINDFDTHIPRITQFWNLQINGKIDDKSLLPFSFLEIHKALKINRGEIFRWVKLFVDILKKNHVSKQLTDSQLKLWEGKINLFSSKLDQYLFRPGGQ